MRLICLAMFLVVGSSLAATVSAQMDPGMAATHPAGGPSVTLTLRGGDGLMFEDLLTALGSMAVPPELAERADREGQSNMLVRDQSFEMGETPGHAVSVSLADGVHARLSWGPPRRGALNLRLAVSKPDGQALLDAAANRIVAALVEKPPLPDAQRNKRLTELTQQIGALDDQMNLLRAMAKNNVTIGPEILKERIKAAELEKQRLEMDLAALHVRGRVIAQEVERITREVEKARSEDEVLARLREIIPLRQKEVERMQTMIDKGVARREELAGVEEKVVQARVRVAEREEAIRQSTKATLLERLNDELATVMINRAEMETRLAMIREQQPSIDLASIGEEKLQHLTEQYRPLFRNPGAMPPLYAQLEKKMNGLKREYLALTVTDVTVTPGDKAP